MSGIFGFSSRQIQPDMAKERLDGLCYWNRAYGGQGSDRVLEAFFGIGCHVEHLSDRYPASAPVIREREQIAVIDAVLYNREELTPQLGVPENISDEELLLRLIQVKGFDALGQVNGDFAGAIYHRSTKTWTLFRDHMGVRPLYFYLDEDLFGFSTDLRGLLAMPGADTAMDEDRVYRCMMGYNDLTLCGTDYKSIRCIRPASWTVIRDGKTEEHRYWRLRRKKIRLGSDEAYQKRLRFLIEDAVKRRMDAVPGPIGSELSGGLDSGVISILISRMGREGKYFSWSYPPEELPLREGDDERKIIFDICQQENVSCRFTPRHGRRTISDIFRELTPPYVNTHNLSDSSEYLRSQGARVVFTGHGGDEGVSHRCNALELWHHGEFLSFTKIFWDTTKGKKWRILRTVKRAARQALKVNPIYKEPYENIAYNSREFLLDSFKAKHAYLTSEPLFFAYDPAAYVEQGGTRVRLDNVAYHGAKNGMRYMIPFVDHRVIDFAVSIPRRLYVHEGRNRYIYRQAFRDILPESLYVMQYKDTSSQRDFQPDMAQIREQFLDTVHTVVGELDRQLWKDILDFERIDSFTLAPDFTRGDYTRAAFLLHDLTRCVLIQNAGRESGSWRERHG